MVFDHDGRLGVFTLVIIIVDVEHLAKNSYLKFHRMQRLEPNFSYVIIIITAITI